MVATRPFGLLAVWTTLYITSKYFYIVTLHEQLVWASGSEATADAYALVFSICLPASAAMVPFSLLIVRLPLAAIIGTMAAVSALGGLLAATAPLLPIGVQLLTFFCILVARFLFFTFAPILVARLYGADRQKPLYGILLFTGGILSNSNYFSAWLSVELMDGSFALANTVLFAATALAGAAVAAFTYATASSDGYVAFD